MLQYFNGDDRKTHETEETEPYSSAVGDFLMVVQFWTTFRVVLGFVKDDSGVLGSADCAFFFLLLLSKRMVSLTFLLIVVRHLALSLTPGSKGRTFPLLLSMLINYLREGGGPSHHPEEPKM